MEVVIFIITLDDIKVHTAGLAFTEQDKQAQRKPGAGGLVLTEIQIGESRGEWRRNREVTAQYQAQAEGEVEE